VFAPLLMLVITDRVGRGAAGAIPGSLITFGVGALLWFVPIGDRHRRTGGVSGMR